MSTNESRMKNKIWPWRSIWKMRMTGCKLFAGGTPCALWRQLDAHKIARSSLQERKVAMLLGSWISNAPTTDNGTSTSPYPPPPPPTPPRPTVPSPLQCLHKGTGRSEQQWFKPGAYACGRRAYPQHSQ